MNTAARQFSYRRALYRCFFDRAFYTDVRYHWEGLGFVYLLFLNCLIMIPALIVFHIMLDRIAFDETHALHKDLAAAVDSIIAHTPELIWHDGQMSSPAEQPYVVDASWHNETRPFAIISEEGTLEELEASPAILLLSKEHLYVKKDDKIEVQSWHDMRAGDMALNAETLRLLADESYQWLQEYRLIIHGLMLLVLGGMLLLAMQLYRMAQALLFGLLALITDKLYGTGLRYDAAVRVAAVAITPAILINVLLTAAGAGGISIAMSGAITLAYLIFAIRPPRSAA